MFGKKFWLSLLVEISLYAIAFSLVTYFDMHILWAIFLGGMAANFNTLWLKNTGENK